MTKKDTPNVTLAWRPSVPVLGAPEVQLDSDLPKGFDPDDLDDQMFEGRESLDPTRTDVANV